MFFLNDFHFLDLTRRCFCWGGLLEKHWGVQTFVFCPNTSEPISTTPGLGNSGAGQFTGKCPEQLALSLDLSVFFSGGSWRESVDGQGILVSVFVFCVVCVFFVVFVVCFAEFQL